MASHGLWKKFTTQTLWKRLINKPTVYRLLYIPLKLFSDTITWSKSWSVSLWDEGPGCIAQVNIVPDDSLRHDFITFWHSLSQYPSIYIYTNYICTLWHIHYCWRCLEVEWPLPSCVSLRNFALSAVAPLTGTGIPEPFMLILPPEEGVASLLSLTLLSTAPSGTPPSAPRIDRLRRVGTLSFPALPLRPTSV